ncbi:MAG: 50S ribosomal protein L22 [Bryobacteraceae bacterium]
MEARAEARYVRISPQKARLVIDLIRGSAVNDAIAILRVTNKRVAPAVEKLVRSAVANAADRSADVDVDKLVVTEAYVNEGPRQKRIRPAPMGRAYRYQRRTSHIVVKVAEA